ncbi:hypothetical protein NKH77_45180 [Streptomyces sp. M19]
MMCLPWSYAGAPALTVPAGTAAGGLPSASSSSPAPAPTNTF